MYSVKKELFVITLKHFNSDEFKLIGTVQEIRNKLLDDGYTITKINRLDVDAGEEISKQFFVPKRYRTKEIVNPKYELDHKWNKIWNS